MTFGPDADTKGKTITQTEATLYDRCDLRGSSIVTKGFGAEFVNVTTDASTRIDGGPF